jgi:hypothetical protein
MLNVAVRLFVAVILASLVRLVFPIAVSLVSKPGLKALALPVTRMSLVAVVDPCAFVFTNTVKTCGALAPIIRVLTSRAVSAWPESLRRAVELVMA